MALRLRRRTAATFVSVESPYSTKSLPAVGLEPAADVASGRETARNDANGSELESVGDVSRHPWTESWTISDVAQAYLDAGAAGLPCAELAVALARGVLDQPEVQFALQVLGGGPFAHARATELATQVLEAKASQLTSSRRSKARAGDCE